MVHENTDHRSAKKGSTYLTGISIRFGNNLPVLGGKDWKDENFFPLTLLFSCVLCFAKGQKISEAIFFVLISSKKPMKFFLDFQNGLIDSKK